MRALALQVLDMCAAPGSKTFQLLEMLHAGPEPASGLVVANDADPKRCNLLVHQTKRMCSPALLVTNHEGQFFPVVRPRSAAKVAEHGALLYDRILCDVPCSGDGTTRKSPDIWRRWTAANGSGLHSLQLRITLQACRLLKVSMIL
jgi:16S rRNA C967 or C1407 C5-methylase (RsmB/RsmF family)